MNKSSKNTNINSEEIKKYLSEKMSAKEKHQVEKQLLDDAFAADASDGFEALNADKINQKVVNIDLKKRLEKRISQEEKKKIIGKTIPLWQTISVAASVLLVLGVGFYFFTQKIDNQEVTEKKEIILSSKPSEVIVSKNVEKDDLAMNEKPINKSKIDKEIASEILANKEESPPPVQSEIAVAKVENQADEKPVETPPVPAQIEQETRRAAMPKPSVATVDKAEIYKQFSGQILDTESLPMTGATVIQKNTNKGVQTDINGNFHFDDLKIGDVLQINSIGYNSQEFVVKSSDLGKIKLTQDTQTLSEVVVVGYGSEAKKSQPNKQLNQEPIPEVGWNNYDNYLINSLKKTGSVSTLTFDEPLKLRLTVEPNGKLSNVQIENKLSKEQTEKVVEVIEKGPKWLPARKKGRKIKKEVLRELKLK